MAALHTALIVLTRGRPYATQGMSRLDRVRQAAHAALERALELLLPVCAKPLSDLPLLQAALQVYAAVECHLPVRGRSMPDDSALFPPSCRPWTRPADVLPRLVPLLRTPVFFEDILLGVAYAVSALTPDLVRSIPCPLRPP